jgi:hypothetical protein
MPRLIAGQPASSQFNQSLQKSYTHFFFFGGPCWWGEHFVVGDTVIVPVTAGTSPWAGSMTDRMDGAGVHG